MAVVYPWFLIGNHFFVIFYAYWIWLDLVTTIKQRLDTVDLTKQQIQNKNNMCHTITQRLTHWLLIVSKNDIIWIQNIYHE